MMKKKGVSEIIATILIILLVLAAIIIVWQVVSNVIKGGATTVEERSKCIDVSLAFDEGSVVCYGGGSRVNATITRGGDSAGTVHMVVIAKSNRTEYATAPITLGTQFVSLTGVGAVATEKVTVRVAPVVGAAFDVYCDPSATEEVTCS